MMGLVDDMSRTPIFHTMVRVCSKALTMEFRVQQYSIH